MKCFETFKQISVCHCLYLPFLVSNSQITNSQKVFIFIRKLKKVSNNFTRKEEGKHERKAKEGEGGEMTKILIKAQIYSTPNLSLLKVCYSDVVLISHPFPSDQVHVKETKAKRSWGTKA